MLLADCALLTRRKQSNNFALCRFPPVAVGTAPVRVPQVSRLSRPRPATHNHLSSGAERGGSQRTSEQFSVPFLGSIELDPEIRKGYLTVWI